MENDIIKYSIEEIAEKILADSKYESELKNGIEQKIVVDKTYTYFVIDSLNSRKRGSYWLVNLLQSRGFLF